MNPNQTSTSRSRIRISQIVADARAGVPLDNRPTLEEPSRPYTPQMLEERLNPNMMKNISSSQITRGSMSYMNMKSKASSYPAAPPQSNRNTTPSPNDLYGNLRNAVSKGSKENQNNYRSTETSQTNKSKYQGKLLLNDLCDTLLEMEIKYNGKKEISEKEFTITLGTLKDLTLKLGRLLKEDGSSFAPNDLFDLQVHFYEVINQIVNLSDVSYGLKTSFLITVLHYCIQSFTTLEIIEHHNNITIKNIELIATSLYQIRMTSMMKASVRLRKEKEEEEEEGEDEYDHEDYEGKSSSLEMMALSSSTSFVLDPSYLEILIESLQFVWKQLSLFIKHEVETIKKNCGIQSRGHSSGNNSNSTNHTPTSRTRPSRDGEYATESINSHSNTPQQIHQYKRGIYHLFHQSLVISHGFNIAAFLTATLKTFTTDEKDRKLLLQYPMIEAMMMGLSIFEQSSYVQKMIQYPQLKKKEQEKNGIPPRLSRANSSNSGKGESRSGSAKASRGRSNTSNDEDIDELLQLAEQEESRLMTPTTTASSMTIMPSTSHLTAHLEIFPSEEIMNLSIDKLLASLTQMIGMIRNFTVDKTSRQLFFQQSSHFFKKLFLILSKYSYYSELILNIARVLAKLSLYEACRAEITGNLHYLEVLMSIIHKEAENCRKIMNQQEDMNEEEENNENENMKRTIRKGSEGEIEKIEWPVWYTWPLISRIAFTLGNLTTSNEVNRKLLGNDFRGMPSILLLLQVCANSLARIHQQKQDRLENSNDALSMNPYVNLDEDDQDSYPGKKRKDKKSSSQRSHRRDYLYEEENEQDEEQEEDDEYEIDQAAEIELRDVTIKLIRLLANLSIDSQIGIEVGGNHENLQTLLELLMICDQSLEQEEMLLNVVAALTNLTYYSCQYLQSVTSNPTSNDVTTVSADSTGSISTNTKSQQKKIHRLEKTLGTIATQLTNFLFHENLEIVLETLRVLGNLTRLPAVILVFLEQRMEEAFLILLQHTYRPILCAVIGIFINLTANYHGRKKLLETSLHLHILQQWTMILRKLTLDDLTIGILISQALYNLYTSHEFQIWDRPVTSNTMIQTLEELLEILPEETEMALDSRKNRDMNDNDNENEKEEIYEREEKWDDPNRNNSSSSGLTESQQFRKVASAILEILSRHISIERL